MTAATGSAGRGRSSDRARRLSWRRSPKASIRRRPGIGSILVLGVVGTGFAFLLNQQAIAEVGATRASLSTYIIPIVAVIVGIVVLGEPFRWSLVLGGALVVAGASR